MALQNTNTPTGILRIGRDSHLFATQAEFMESIKSDHEKVLLAPDQLVHPSVPADFIVRRGQIRFSQFLANGHEVTRAVLQAGAYLVTRPLDPDNPQQSPNDAADIYNLADIILMSLDDAELWAVPPGSLDQID